MHFCILISDDSVSEEDTQKMKTWLQHNEQPRATMEEYMLKTAKRRQILIKSKGFKEALVEYPKILLSGMVSIEKSAYCKCY